jgi:hypothetical protein
VNVNIHVFFTPVLEGEFPASCISRFALREKSTIYVFTGNCLSFRATLGAAVIRKVHASVGNSKEVC